MRKQNRTTCEWSRGERECHHVVGGEFTDKPDNDGSIVSSETTAENPSKDDEKQEELPKVDIEKSNATQKYFVGTTDKNAVSYQLGEEIRFTVRLYAGAELASCAKFKYVLKADDGRDVETGYADGQLGMFKLTTKLDVPGFVNLQVIACDGDGNEINGVNYFKGGAGADISNIQKAKTEPEDFDAFWQGQLKKLNDTAPDLLEAREVDSPDAAFTVYAVKIRFRKRNTWGNYVAGYLSVPKNAQLGSLSLQVGYMGAGIFDAGKSCNQGTATLIVSAHCLELGQDSTYYGGLMNGTLRSYFDAHNATRETVYFREMILRDIQAVRFMRRYFSTDGADERFRGLWNAERELTLTGGSQGGFQAVAVAALEPNDISMIHIDYPWLCDIGGCGTDGRIASTFMPTYTPALEYYDTVNFGKRLSCPVIIGIEGLGDDIATTTGVTIFWNNLNPSITRQITYVQNQSHSHFPIGETDKFTLYGIVSPN